jgi:hypothetical protein
MAGDEKKPEGKPKPKPKKSSKGVSFDEWIIIAILIILFLVGVGAILGANSPDNFISLLGDKFENFGEIGVVKNTLLVWKIIAGIISLGSLGVIAVTVFLSTQYRVHVSTKKLQPLAGGSPQKVVRKDWMQFLERAAKATPREARMLIIEADSIADLALKRRGAAGEDMGERLKSVGRSLSRIDELWDLHKLRNTLAHEPGKQVTIKELENAIHSYHAILMELGAI